MSSSRDTIEYKLSYNILIDSFREVVQGNLDTYGEALEFIEDLDQENFARLLVEDTHTNVQAYAPLDRLYQMNPRAVSNAVVDIKRNVLFKQFNDEWKRKIDRRGDETEVENEKIPSLVQIAKNILDADLYIREVQFYQIQNLQKIKY